MGKFQPNSFKTNDLYTTCQRKKTSGNILPAKAIRLLKSKRNKTFGKVSAKEIRLLGEFHPDSFKTERLVYVKN